MIKILVAEDKPLIRRGIISMIDWESNSCQLVGEAENGKEAIRLINALKPDIVLTDIKMPLIDGLSILNYINDSHLPIKTIIISGYDNFEYAKQALLARSVDYILKPIHEDELNFAIASACRQITAEMQHNANNPENSIDAHLQSALRSVDYRTFSHMVPLLQIPSDCSCFCVATLQNKYNIYDGLKERIKGLFPPFIHVYCTDNQSSFDMLFAFPREHGYQTIIQVLTNLHLILDEPFKNGCHLGVGNVLNQDAYIHEGKDQALQALCHKILLPSEFLLEYQKLIKRPSVQPNLPKLEKQLLDYLVSGNAAAAIKLCRDTINTYTQENSSLKGLGILLTQFYCILLHTNTGCATDIQSEINRVNQTEYILSCENLDAFTRPLYLFCTQISEEILAKNNNDIISEVRQYLQKHFTEEISLKYLEQIFHLNASYLSVLFKKENGVGINRYVNQLRLAYAEKLLMETDYKLSKVAEKCGLPNYIHFTKIFKQNFGVSPSEYRKRKRGISAPTPPF